MEELVFVGPRRVEWHEHQPAELTSVAAVVRPTAVSTCDMDEFALRGTIRFRGPAPLGHEAVGIIEETGAEVSRFAVGDRVVVPWQISCGRGGRCGAVGTRTARRSRPDRTSAARPHISRWRRLITGQVVHAVATFEAPFTNLVLTR